MTDSEKSTNEELDQRLEIVRYALVELGLKQSVAVRYCLKHHPEWDVSDRQIRNYCAMVTDQLRTEAMKDDRPAHFSRWLQRLEMTWRRSVKANDTRTMLGTVNAAVKWLHLDEPMYALDWRKAMEQNGFDPAKTFEQLVNAIAETNGKSTDE